MSIKLLPYAHENMGMYYSHKTIIAGVTFYVCEKGILDNKWHAAIETGEDAGGGYASFSAVGNTMQAAIRHCLSLQRAFVMKALEAK